MRVLFTISLGLELDLQLVDWILLGLGLVIQVFELPALELHQLLIQQVQFQALVLQPLLLQAQLL